NQTRNNCFESAKPCSHRGPPPSGTSCHLQSSTLRHSHRNLRAAHQSASRATRPTLLKAISLPAISARADRQCTFSNPHTPASWPQSSSAALSLTQTHIHFALAVSFPEY